MNQYKENECSCSICQDMCKTPCIGTPEDIMKIAMAGFMDGLTVSSWRYGELVGTHQTPVMIVSPKKDENKGYCTFFNDGKCQLHDLGLKPTEGRFASHDLKPVAKLEDLFETPLYQCISKWENLKL